MVSVEDFKQIFQTKHHYVLTTDTQEQHTFTHHALPSFCKLLIGEAQKVHRPELH